MAMNCSSAGGQDSVLGGSSLSPLTIGKEDTVKCQFITREGTYKLSKGDNCRTTVVGYTPPSPQTNTPVKCSFVHIPSSPFNGDLICFNVGKELYVCNYKGIKKATDLNNPIDKRSYKGLYPTCHDFNQVNISSDYVYLLVGLSAGQIQLIDPIKKEISKLYNEERAIDKTKVTCIKWVPGSMNLFLVSHSSGQLYVYKEDLPCGSTTPHYQMFKQGEGFAIYTCKTKSTRNPLYRWVIGEGSINEIAFSPCSKYLATVSQDGFLRVFNYDTMELVGRVRSYFGGLLCVCWSPDSKFIVIGGEDDLVTVWSLHEKRVIARGQGHKSWVSVVAFDPYTTIVRDTVDNSGCNVQSANDDNEITLRNDVNDSNHLQPSSSTSTIKTNRSSPISTSETNSNHLTTSTTTITTYRNTVNKSPISNNSNNNNSTSSSIITSYRFGSVGQDTQLCLWELTEDVIKQPVGRSRTSILLHSPTSGSNQQSLSTPSSIVISSSSSTTTTATTTTSSGHHSNQLTNCSNADKCQNLQSPLVTNCLSNNCNYLDPGSVYTNHVGNTLAPTAAVHSTSSSSGGYTNKHGDGSGSGMTTLTKKEHKRNFSLASRNSDKNSLNKTSHSKLIDDPIRLLGTTICPRLDEVPLLEPLICKKIAHERLTSLVFKEDCFVAACQEGYIFTWVRPSKWENMQIAPSPIPSIEEESAMVDENESTVV
ncbi:WD repeat-containing protein 20-like [Panonychus citri]|uniref:WD repeat-containing protein 20-like n=1 Tax=Panonychus citri TaxID=50023 RepID=UPI002307E243|nr:WD repeat-containing protein 20-like [Panonychus citri]